MADIQKCDAAYAEGKSCPFKYSCRRFTAGVSPHVQAWMTAPPYREATHSCEMFLSNAPAQLHKHGGEKRP